MKHLRVQVDVEVSELVDVCPDAEETVLLRVKVLDFVKSGCLGKVTLHGVAKTQDAESDQLVKTLWNWTCLQPWNLQCKTAT